MSYGTMLYASRSIMTPYTDMNKFVKSILGYRQYENTKASTQAQIDYNEYIKRGNQRALADWNRNVGSKGRTIRYPELSYAGRIYQADTASARAMYDSDTAYANFSGNLPFRLAGLYGIGSRVSRWL